MDFNIHKVPPAPALAMLYAGSDDGVYRITGLRGPRETSADRVLEAERVYRVRQFDGLDGLFVTAESGLYHSRDGQAWTALDHPMDEVYAVGASPTGNRLYTGTRPARVFTTDASDGLVEPAAADWTPLPRFDELRERIDWGLSRHNGLAQVRSLCTTPAAPDRLVVGVEVGGVHVSEDRGETWMDRRISGFDAPHTDDIHHLSLTDGETLVASTGSGLYRSRDLGRTWKRLDTGHEQRYFREALVHDGRVFAGAAPASSASWEADDDHALFVEAADGTLTAEPFPTPDAAPIGWCCIDDTVLGATYRGSLVARRDGEWTAVGEVPTPGPVRGRYLPMTWFEH